MTDGSGDPVRRTPTLAGVSALVLVVLVASQLVLIVYVLTATVAARRVLEAQVCQNAVNAEFRQGLTARSIAQQAYQNADRAYVTDDRTFVQEQARYLRIATDKTLPQSTRDQARVRYQAAIDKKLLSADRKLTTLADLDRIRAENPVSASSGDCVPP